MKLNVFRSGWGGVVLIAAGIPLAIVGVASAQTVTDYFGMMATSVFAATLLISLLCNAAIVLAWRRHRPLLLTTPLAIPLLQTLLLSLEVLWIIAILTNDAFLGIPVGAMIACVSIAVFVAAVTPDGPASHSQLERTQRRAAARDARTPVERRRRRIRAWVTTGVLLAAVAVPVTIVQTTITVHPDCDVNGAILSGATIIVSSTDCGEFFMAGGEREFQSVSNRFERYDIVTRGFWLGRPVLVELRPVGT